MMAIFLGVNVLTASQAVGILRRRSDFEQRNCDERSENPYEASWKNYVQRFGRPSFCTQKLG